MFLVCDSRILSNGLISVFYDLFHFNFTPSRNESGPSSLKHKQPDSTSLLDLLAEQERVIYNVIGSKQGIGIRL